MKYYNQSGRSMIEMIGTLAIIGVLSIGGIVGYSYGIDKYKANKTMHDIQLRAVDLLAQIQNKNDDLTLDAWKDEQTLYPISLVFDDESNDPLIQVSNVPERVCEMIVKGMETQAAITVNSYYSLGQEDGGCEEINDLTFYFGDYEACGTNYCSGDKPACHPDTQTCVECLNSGDCPSDKPVCNASNACEACPDSKPFYDAATGVCGDCQSDDDCTGESICLNNNQPYVNYTNGPNLGGFNKCTTFSYVSILSADESPDGKEWGKLKLPSGSGSHRNAAKLCAKVGKIVPFRADYTNEWISQVGHIKTATATALCEKDGYHHTWAAEKKGNAGMLINLSVSEIGVHPYYHTDTASLRIYCRSK